jgi:hypothetical protein
MCLPKIQFRVPGFSTLRLFDTPAQRQQRSRSKLKKNRSAKICELCLLETQWEREALVVQTKLEVQRTQLPEHCADIKFYIQ